MTNPYISKEKNSNSERIQKIGHIYSDKLYFKHNRELFIKANC